MSQPSVVISARVSKALETQIKIEAKQQRRKVSEIIIFALEKYFGNGKRVSK